MRLSSISAIAASVILAFSSCDRQAKWQVKGIIEGADNAHLRIERAENGVWLALDTLSTDSKGRFEYSHLPLGYPDIYRLAYDGKYIYFPIDSIETVRISTKADAFSTGYTISGSEYADKMMAIDGMVAERVREVGAEAALTDSVLKRRLNETIVAEPAAITAYYIVLKQVNGKFLYVPSVPADNRIIGAVANAYVAKRPDDPRTRFLREIYLRNRSVRPQDAERFEITELPYYDIDLMDYNGTHHKLSDVVSGNKVVLLNFTAYAAQESPAFNILLADSYRKYHGNGLEIYQVSVDEDEYQWGQTARNLPWVTVYNPPVGKQSNILQLYNVMGLPTTFLFVNGELRERIDDHQTLGSRLATLF